MRVGLGLLAVAAGQQQAHQRGAGRLVVRRHPDQFAGGRHRLGGVGLQAIHQRSQQPPVRRRQRSRSATHQAWKSSSRPIDAFQERATERRHQLAQAIHFQRVHPTGQHRPHLGHVDLGAGGLERNLVAIRENARGRGGPIE